MAGLGLLGAVACDRPDTDNQRTPQQKPVATAPVAQVSWGPIAGKTVGAATEYPVPVPDAALMIPFVAPDNRVWVSAMNTSSLMVFDPLSLSFEQIKVAPGANEFDRLSPDHTSSASRYTWECVSTSELGLMGLAVDPASGAVWFAEQNADRLGVYNPATGAIRDFLLPTKGSAPNAVAIDASGRVWTTALGANKIVVLDPAKGSFTEFDLPGADASPYSLAVGAGQTIWFTQFSRGAIGALDPASGTIREYAVAGARGTTAVTIDAAGRPWFTTAEGQLVRLDPLSGEMFAVTVPIDGRLYGVTVDRSGNVWVGGLASRLAAYDPAADQWRVVEMPTAGSSSWWPVASPSGDVWSVEPGANNLVRVRP